MSVEGFTPIPLDQFGGLVTLQDKRDVPVGLSPDCQNVEFVPGLVRTRPGLTSPFAALGTAKINGIKTFIPPSLFSRTLVFASDGILYREEPAGTLEAIYSLAPLDSYMRSDTLFGREYIAFYNRDNGADLPRHYDDETFGRVSQVGPGEGPSAADTTNAGAIVAGEHDVVVWFETETGYWTKPSPKVTWTAGGDLTVNITDIPIGPANVKRRLLAFTPLNSEDFYHLPDRMVLADNTTTSLEVDFSEGELVVGENVNSLFRLIELPKNISVIGYAKRLFWWGETARMHTWRNLTFDGGFTGGRPLGWTAGANFAGGSKENTDVIAGDAYKITGDGATAVRGEITQDAVTEVWDATPLIAINTLYKVRARVKRSAGLVAGTLEIDVSGTGIDTVGLTVTAAQATTSWQEFEAELTVPLASVPADLLLRVFVSGTPTNAEYFLVEEIEIAPSVGAGGRYNATIVRASLPEDPESYDGLDGFLSIQEDNGQAMRAAFRIREFLYLVKQNSLYVTADDGINEPSRWTVEEVSPVVGTPSPNGVGIGEDWALICAREGVYHFSGGSPKKISQEIQPTWDSINWGVADKIWCVVNIDAKQAYIGVPIGAATEPDQILMLDFTEGFEDPLANEGRGRKWAPWTILTNSAAMIEETGDFKQRVYFGSNSGDGLVKELAPGTFNDNGAAIDNYYDTAYLSTTPPYGRQLFGFLTFYGSGIGTLELAAILPDETDQSIPSVTLADPAPKDLERMLNIKAERVAFRFRTNAVDEHFSIAKATLFAAPDPWAYVRGHN